MTRSMTLGVLVWALTLVGLATIAPAPSGAQVVADTDIVDIPGVGPVDLNELPPELRDNLRLPGVEYAEPLEEIPAELPEPEPPEPPPSTTSPNPPPIKELPPPADDAERKAREDAIRRLYPQETMAEKIAKEEAYAEQAAQVPEDAYLRALEHASIIGSDTPTHNGWYKSIDRAQTCTPVFTGVQPGRARIAYKASED